MAQDKRDDFLYLTWGDPNSGKRFIVGKLTRGERFVFEYTGCSEAEKCGWERLEAFPEEKRYESETLFSIFSSRLPNPKRRDMDKILGLEYGADDYITKPFNILEVKARIKAIMRRTGRHKEERPGHKLINAGEMEIDCESRRVRIAGREINLTAKEFDLLELLATNPGKVYSRENLLNIVWGYEYPGDARTVDVHIRRLREKIETNPSDPKYVYTKWGVGYYFRG